jgi:hypothetical protein
MKTQIQNDLTPAAARISSIIVESGRNSGVCKERAREIVNRSERTVQEPSDLHKRFLQQIADKYGITIL